MARIDIKGPIDDGELNGINHNFIELFTHYLKSGLNAKQALNKAASALLKSENALNTANQTQKQIDNLILSDGESDAEVIQARGRHNLLYERFDEIDKDKTENDEFRHYESMVSRKEPDGLYATWIDDDGTGYVYPRLKPILEKYNIPITSAIITKNIDDERRLPQEKRDELEELGMEFISHTHNHDTNHRPVDMTEEELEEDFKLSKQIMKENGYNYRGLVLPFGDNTDLIQKVARRHFDYVIGTGANKSGFPNYPREIDNYYIWRVTVEYDWEFVKKQLDEAHEKGVAWVVFVSHISGDWYSNDFVEQVIDYALSLGFKFCTAQEGINRFGNIAQFGNNKITSTNEIVSDQLGKVIFINNKNIKHDTPITEFEKDKCSVFNVKALDTEDFPDERSGVLCTYRFKEDIYSYQKYLTTRHKRSYIRFWDRNEQKWSDWINDQPVSYLGFNALDSEQDPTIGAPVNKITYTHIDSDKAYYFPEGHRGLLKTYSFESSGLPFQEYFLFQKEKVYKRFWYGSQGWSTWRLVQNNVVVYNEGQDNITSDKKPEDFEEGITIGYISAAANDTGLPDNSSGVLTTYKITDSSGRSYQEFKKYNSFDKFIRYADSSNKWSDWKRFALETI